MGVAAIYSPGDGRHASRLGRSQRFGSIGKFTGRAWKVHYYTMHQFTTVDGQSFFLHSRWSQIRVRSRIQLPPCLNATLGAIPKATLGGILGLRRRFSPHKPDGSPRNQQCQQCHQYPHNLRVNNANNASNTIVAMLTILVIPTMPS